MKMKKSLLVLAVFGTFAGAAQAEDSLLTLRSGDNAISFYGVVDAAVASQNHSYSISPTLPNQIYPFQSQPINGNNNSVTGLISGGLSDSRWGFKGEVGLGQGTKAIFDVESGFSATSGQVNNAAATLAANPSTTGATPVVKLIPVSVNADSSLNGQLFGRAAWVGLSDATMGALTIGRQNNPMKDVFAAYDPVKSDTFSPFGESGAVGGGGGISEEARMDNSIKYENTFAGGFKLVGAYQFDNKSGGTTQGSKGYALRLGYENDTFGVQAVYNNFTDATKATTSATPGDIAINLYDTDAYLLAGKYKVMQDLTLNAGYEHYTLKAASDPTMTMSTIWGYTVSGVSSKFAPGVSQDFNVYYLGGDYNINPKLNLSAGYYNWKQDNSTGSSTSDGTVHTFSAVLDYKMFKMVDVYAALTTNNYGGDAYPSATFNTSVTAYALGARLKF